MGQRKGEKNVGWQPETQPKGKPPVENTKGAETMQRMIDANALKESIDEHAYLVNHGFSETEYGCTQYGIHQIIDEAPTIDAVPVRRGEWTVTPIYIKCSECGESFMLIPQNYCPNCGARMDEERKEE